MDLEQGKHLAEVLACTLIRPVSVLNLDMRTENCLARERIRTIGDLVMRAESDIRLLPNFGKISLRSLKDKLADMGLCLGMGAVKTARDGTECRNAPGKGDPNMGRLTAKRIKTWLAKRGGTVTMTRVYDAGGNHVQTVMEFRRKSRKGVDGKRKPR